MAFKTTQWEFSNEIDEASVPPEEGVRNLFIRDASFDDASGVYTLEITDLGNNGEFRLKHYLYARDDFNNVIPGQLKSSTRGTLITLGKALAGPMAEIGIPAPCDIIGGVVRAQIQVKTSKMGRPYPVTYAYMPVEKDLAELAGIEQYWIGQEEMPEEAAEGIEG